ncbi:MAG TPA: Arm DNA-binding domain-containing protein [Acidobacteriaceae bacterium]|jgi:hypothetical protein|nr:Arm DNA-binding domain-containing protein [Acidobacteriaceae bacterium]
MQNAKAGSLAGYNSQGFNELALPVPVDGKQEKVHLGPYSEICLKRAREKRDILAVQVAEGISPAHEKRKAKIEERASITLREFGDRYYREQVLTGWKDPSNERRNL